MSQKLLLPVSLRLRWQLIIVGISLIAIIVSILFQATLAIENNTNNRRIPR